MPLFLLVGVYCGNSQMWCHNGSILFYRLSAMMVLTALNTPLPESQMKILYCYNVSPLWLIFIDLLVCFWAHGQTWWMSLESIHCLLFSRSAGFSNVCGNDSEGWCFPLQNCPELSDLASLTCICWVCTCQAPRTKNDTQRYFWIVYYCSD